MLRIIKSLNYRSDLFINRIKYIFNIGKIRNNNPRILNTIDTINLIATKNYSFSRFGDGEFYLMLGLNYSPFQECTPELTNDLLEIICSNKSGMLIRLPDTFNDVKKYERNSKKFWQSFMGKYRNQIIKCLPHNYLEISYGNTNSTRFYSDMKDKSLSKFYIKYFKKIWNKKTVICIEGEKTRLGVGNDLFDNTIDVKRILVPAKNAYSEIYHVLEWIIENIVTENTIFILAAGMAATVLSYRLFENGFQALDLGHIDIQYEYLLRKSHGKEAIPGKYVNENMQGRNPNDEILDDKYQKSIIAKFL
jgi:glycosyltransferase family protein